MNFPPFPIFDLPWSNRRVRTFQAPTVNAFGETVHTSTESQVKAVVHSNVSRKQLERLNHADQARQLISVYTADPIFGVGTTRPQQVQYQSQWYEVIDRADYEVFGGVWLITAALIEETS